MLARVRRKVKMSLILRLGVKLGMIMSKWVIYLGDASERASCTQS